MGLQLIFVVETNKKCNSDWIYIKDTIEYFFQYDRTQLKLSVVYMDGKGNYNSNKKKKEIQSLISQYKAGAKNNRSKVIYCLDCDEFDRKPEDSKFIEDVRLYCDSNKYDFIWFCKDIEQVYIGKKVPDNQKKKEAAIFKVNKAIKKVNAEKLSCHDKNYQINTSNILTILNQYIELS